MPPRVSRVPAAHLKPGVCFGCGHRYEPGCGMEWIDTEQTMCSNCDRSARRYLAWYKFRELQRQRARIAGVKVVRS